VAGSTLTEIEPNLSELGDWLRSPGFRAPRATVVHHTYKPTAAQYRGRDTIVGIRRYHMQTRGASDIMANLYATPRGDVVTGRPLSAANWAHAYVSREHPEAALAAYVQGDRMLLNRVGFGVEIVGDFDVEAPTGDGLAARSMEAGLDALAVVHYLFDIPTAHLFCHRDAADKSCPGKRVARSWLRSEVESRVAEIRARGRVKVLLCEAQPPTEVACQPQIVDSDMTVAAKPFLAAVGWSGATPPGVVHENGRAYVHDLAPLIVSGWWVTYRASSQGPRLYLRRKVLDAGAASG
jgi:hypothetical protein